MPKKKAENLYRSYEDIISELPDGTIYPCTDDPNYGKMTKKGKIIGCVKGDGYWVGGTSVNREDVELVSDTEIVRVSELPQIEQDLISPDLQTVESRLADIESDPDIARMIQQSGKTPSKYQRAIYHEVKSGSGNVVIEARAGSGKTTTLVNALKLIPKNKRILVSAFNVKIAAELRARCPSNVDVMTLHGFGLRQLKKFLKEKGMVKEDEYEDTDEYSLPEGEETSNELIIDKEGYYMQKYISSFLINFKGEKDKLRDMDELRDFLMKCLNMAQAQALNPSDEDIVEKLRKNIPSRIIKKEEELKRLTEILSRTSVKDVLFQIPEAVSLGLEYGVIDFGVLMTIKNLKYTRSFKKKGKAKEMVNGKLVSVEKEGLIYSFNDMIYITAVSEKIEVDQYDYIFIDEAQDMNLAQIKMLLKAGNKARIFVIGDPRQAIYLFNYSELDMMQKMETVLNAKKLYLSVSYRAPKSVAELAKKCVTDFEVPETAIEGEVNYISGGLMINLLKPGDIIIGRKNEFVTKVASLLIYNKIPVIILGVKNYDKMLEQAIKNLVGPVNANAKIQHILEDRRKQLEIVVDELDDAISSRDVWRMESTIIKYGVNKAPIESVRKEKSKDEFYRFIMAKAFRIKSEYEQGINEIDMIERLVYAIKAENLSDLIKGAKELIGNFPAIKYRGGDNQAKVRQLMERFEREKAEALKKFVILTSVHQFKGSEADRVFVLDYTFSSHCERPYDLKTAEEDNLYYVAVTRAKKQLFMVSGDFEMEQNEESDPV